MRTVQAQHASLIRFREAHADHIAEAAHWQLLFQVASSRRLGMQWWDSGVLQFLIDERDLANRDFSHCSIQTT